MIYHELRSSLLKELRSKRTDDKRRKEALAVLTELRKYKLSMIEQRWQLEASKKHLKRDKKYSVEHNTDGGVIIHVDFL